MSESSLGPGVGQSGHSEVALLSRLLSDSQLRQRFREDAQSVALELADDEADVTFLLAIDHAQLEAQAETLVSKRQHEVAQLLPLTWKQLGQEAAGLFRTYAAESAWPEGHTRHLGDAIEFGLWLSRRSQHEPVGSEWNRIRFAASGRRLAARIVRDRRVRFGLQILVRQRNGRIRQLVLQLGLPWRRLAQN
jgi:hypothetical protein